MSRTEAAAIFAALSAAPVLAAPPPPPPPGAMERAERIATAPDSAHVADYARQFTPDVKIYDNERLVASSREGWSAYLGRQAGLRISRHEISYGNPIIVTETLNNMGVPAPGVARDCCFWARVASYHLNKQGLVDQVRFLENRSPWEPPSHPR